MDKVTAEVKEGGGREDKGMKGKYSGRVYRYAMAPAINIAGKVDVEGRVGGTVAEVLSLAFTMKRRKDTPSSSGAVSSSPPPCLIVPPIYDVGSPTLVSFPSRCTPLDSAVVEVHFIPTFNKASRLLRGFIKN